MLELGIYGDSYADPNYVELDPECKHKHGWPVQVIERLYGNYDQEDSRYVLSGISGTSIWYPYKKIVEDIKEYKQTLKTIVWVCTDMYRFPGIVDEHKDKAWMLPRLHFLYPELDEELKDFFVKYAKFVDSVEFMSFVYNSALSHVEKLCAENGIRLIKVSVIPENENPLVKFSTSNSLFLDGLVNISRLELGSMEYYWDTVNDSEVAKNFLNSWEGPKGNDGRCCHMTAHNNTWFAELVCKYIDNDQVGYIDIKDIDGWRSCPEDWHKYSSYPHEQDKQV